MKKKNIPLEKIVELHNQGLYDFEIAELLNCTRANITKRLNKAGYRNRMSKIDDMQTRDKISQSLIGKYTGENNPNYKGRLNEKWLARGMFKTLSKKMIRQANYTCQICGKRGGNMGTHHKYPFHKIMEDFYNDVYNDDITTFYEQLSNYPPFMDENNLIVLCEECHKKIHSNGNHEPSLD